MLTTTLSRLRCPKLSFSSDAGELGALCGGTLRLSAHTSVGAGALDRKDCQEIRSGTLTCNECDAEFPILAGVAVLVEDVESYLLTHVKGLSRVVPDSEIPAQYLSDYLEAKAEIESEHIEEDLEAERVVSLYLMNHYLRTSAVKPWWKPETGEASPLIDELVKKYWDHGPFEQIRKWVAQLAQKGGPGSSGGSVVELATLELGCGVGGLYLQIEPFCREYLGVDSSFTSIALGRHLALGVPYGGKIRIPQDLLQGPVSLNLGVFPATRLTGNADLVVGDLECLPVVREEWDLTLALNAIDMMNEPALLPRLQQSLLKKGGVAIQSCPYIWHEVVAKELREILPKAVNESSRAVEWLYEREGFEIRERIEHLPWLFYKHFRQLEIYSVHLFVGVLKA